MILNKIKLILLIVLSICLLNGCGYKVLNKSNGNFNIIEITDSGETRINCKIKIKFYLDLQNKVQIFLNSTLKQINKTN